MIPYTTKAQYRFVPLMDTENTSRINVIAAYTYHLSGTDAKGRSGGVHRFRNRATVADDRKLQFSGRRRRQVCRCLAGAVIMRSINVITRTARGHVTSVTADVFENRPRFASEKNPEMAKDPDDTNKNE